VTVRIACAQLNLPVGDVDGCLEKTCRAIVAARDKGADLVVLPELASCGYPLNSADEAKACADHASVCLERWTHATGGDVTVVAGFCERSGDEVYNSCALIDRSGVRAIYRKLHLWDREKLLFTPGSEAPPLIDTSFGRLAMAICYDLEFPELTRNLALQGADVLALPTATPFKPRPAGTHPMAVTLAMSTARLNGMFLACCDHCGSERGMTFDGGSVIVSNIGWLADGPVDGYGEGLVIADCDLTVAADKKRGERNDLFADRRPQLYTGALDQSSPSARA
jgi:5-aminopentanamidase